MLKWLQDFYFLQKKETEIKISTLDNPGWWIDIRLRNDKSTSDVTNSEILDFQGKEEHNWVHCKIEDNILQGRCGPLNLEQLLLEIKNWHEKKESKRKEYQISRTTSDTLIWLQKFYLDSCDGDWEHSYGISIKTAKEFEWRLKIDLLHTVLADRHFEEIHEKKTNENWISCKIENNIFKGGCSGRNLENLIIIFRNWVSKLNLNYVALPYEFIPSELAAFKERHGSKKSK